MHKNYTTGRGKVYTQGQGQSCCPKLNIQNVPVVPAGCCTLGVPPIFTWKAEIECGSPLGGSFLLSMILPLPLEKLEHPTTTRKSLYLAAWKLAVLSITISPSQSPWLSTGHSWACRWKVLFRQGQMDSRLFYQWFICLLLCTAL